MLIRLLKSQVDPKPAVRARMVSALLMGGNVTVPIGKTVGGDFKRIPACRSRSQTGCVVAYSSFLDPPPADSPNQYSAHCQYKNGISWLQVNVIPHPGDPRPVVTQSLGPTWGLHLDDVNLSLGNLVSLVKSQAKAYTQAH